jgi:hypothetical protein
MEINMSDIIIYEDGNLELKVEFDGETVWLSQNELVQLFDKDQSVIYGILIKYLKIMKLMKKAICKKCILQIQINQ